VLSQFFRSFLAIVAPNLIAELGLGPAELGALSGIWFGAFAVAQFPIGWGLDTFGARRTIAGAMLCAIAGAFLFAAAPGFGAMLAAMALIGVGCGPVLMGSMFVFGRAYPPERFALLSSAVLGFGSLGVLLASSLWHLDSFGNVVKSIGLVNFETLLRQDIYRVITLRTIKMAAAVTLTCAVLAFPIAFTMAKVARPRARRALIVAVLLPLWASYVVKVYAWRNILAQEGILNWMLRPFGLEGPGFGPVAMWLVFTYLWLPYMILPIYAGLERIPDSLVDASYDLGASPFTTFRKVIFPLAFPAVVAGSIFTFSLTLGDYITPQLVSSTQFIGNVVYANVGVANNLPLAAAFATVPVVVMIVYLLVARRLGAFEAL
jgi:putative spermidine/putrescine transport system permease protein